MERRYDITDERAAIREIQTYLLSVTPNDENKGLTRHGIYDSATISAVESFQAREGLDVTGVVDLATWILLYDRHIEATAAKEDEIGMFSFEEMKIGDIGNHVIHLQTLLSAFSNIYPRVIRPAVTGQFGLTTADSVRALQRIYGMTASGVVTHEFLRLMQRDHKRKTQFSQYNRK